MQDQAMIEDIRRGAPGAAARFMQHHNRKLWRIARGILRDDSDAEDVVQETYLRAFARLDDFRGEASLGTWLARIAINEALRRLGARRAGTAMVVSGGESADAAESAESAAPDPEQVAARAEIRRLVERAVDALPAPFRLVFIMRVVEQMSIEETAATLHVPSATVKTRLHRANQQLRVMLGEAFASAFDGAFPFGGLRCDRLTSAVLARVAAASVAETRGGTRPDQRSSSA